MLGIGAGLSILGGITKGILGASQASKARKAIDDYKRQELTNAYDQLSVSTLGADLQREELARASASSIQALQQSGIRGLVGGIGKVQQNNIQQSRQIGADLDMQQRQIEQLVATDDARIRAMQETREQEDLAGLGQQQNVGQQNMFSGIGDVAQGVSAYTNMREAANNRFVGFNPKVQSVGNVTPQGMQGMGFTQYNPFN